MAQPVKLSDELVLDARMVGNAVERSISGQIEHWARIGRAIEPLLTGQQARVISQSKKMPISECFRNVRTAKGREQLKKHLNSLPFPHFEAAPGSSGALIRIDADGTRTTGRFVNREFRALAKPKK